MEQERVVPAFRPRVEKDVTRIKDYFCSELMVQQLNALACEIEENTGNVNEVSLKSAELTLSPLLEKMQKKGKQKALFRQ